MKFTKMQGIGNDYVYVNCFEEQVENPEQAARLVSDRHFGIGSDGLILICPSKVADCRMRMFNEALELYAGSNFVRELLGDHIFYKYFEAKNAEWKKFRAEVTDWEVEEYLYKF